MELRATEIDLGSRTPTVLLHSSDLEELGAHPLDRVQLAVGDQTIVAIVEVTDELVTPGTIGITRSLGRITGDVTVTLAPKPSAAAHLRKKLAGRELEHQEIEEIVQQIAEDRLSDVELSAFVSAIYANGLSHEEMQCLTTCMVDAGRSIDWDRPVVADKHSIGGVAGNRVTPIVVPIVAAAGLTIPKTSSRAVTSAAGTADTMEVFCDVAFSLSEIRDIVDATGGCLVWGGAVDLSPVDDKLIRAETPLSLDPPGQIVASVLSKKKSAGASVVVIDVPYGDGAKVTSLSAARELAEDFKLVGDSLGLTVQVAITRGEQPIGRGVGPVLEARDVLAVLGGGGPPDLRQKAVRLADLLFTACGVDADAAEILADGRAEAKFREIVAAQGGDPAVTQADLVPGRHRQPVTAESAGVVQAIDNSLINEIARRAGSPRDRGAGLELNCRLGSAVEPGDVLFTVYAQTRSKLTDALSFLEGNAPIQVIEADDTLVEEL